MLDTPLGRLRAVGVVEAVSFLLLLGVAMPLRKFYGLNDAVWYAGMAHGVLWVLYLVAVAHVWQARRWSPARVAAALVASVVPAGPFLFDPSLRREQHAVTPPGPAGGP